MQDREFADFSVQLYCSGVVKQLCALPDGARQLPGQCFWLTPINESFASASRPSTNNGWREVTADEVRNHSRLGNREWFAEQYFDPTPAVPSFVHYRPDSVARCMRGKRLLLLGDSTTRDTLYELLAVAGRPIFSWSSLYASPEAAFPRHAYSPYHARMVSAGVDRLGRCLARDDLQSTCVRDMRVPDVRVPDVRTPAASTTGLRSRVTNESARIAYQFLAANASWQLRTLHTKLLTPSRPAYDAAFIQCPTHDATQPNAYNYSLTREERHAPLQDDGAGNVTDALRESITRLRIMRIGAACRQVFELVRNHSPTARLFLLGPTGGGENGSLDLRVVASIHSALGLRCEQLLDGRRFSLISTAGITAIDRYNVWGTRKRDTTHPYFSAQQAAVNLMLNHFCERSPGPGRGPFEKAPHMES